MKRDILGILLAYGSVVASLIIVSRFSSGVLANPWFACYGGFTAGVIC